MSYVCHCSMSSVLCPFSMSYIKSLVPHPVSRIPCPLSRVPCPVSPLMFMRPLLNHPSSCILYARHDYKCITINFFHFCFKVCNLETCYYSVNNIYFTFIMSMFSETCLRRWISNRVTIAIMISQSS